MGKEGKYIYGLIGTETERRFGPIGIGDRGDEVHTILYKDIAAVVSDLPFIEFNSLLKEALVRYLAAHQSVIEQIMKNCTIIPMKFGTMAKDEKDLQKILKQGYYQFKRALESMDNKIELDVVALWSNLNLILQEIGEEERIEKFKQDIAQRPSDQTHEQKIELGKMVKSALDEKGDKCAAEILKVLQGEAGDFRSHLLMNDSMIMNVAFLMDRGKEREFDQKVKELNEKYEERINFRCVAPLPPYSFSTIEVKRMEFEAVDDARKALGLSDEATMFEIKEAHRKLTHKYHPDKNPDDIHAVEQFRRVSEAYKILNDYCQHYRYSFREADVKNFVMVKVLELAESEDTTSPLQ